MKGKKRQTLDSIIFFYEIGGGILMFRSSPCLEIDALSMKNTNGGVGLDNCQKSTLGIFTPRAGGGGLIFQSSPCLGREGLYFKNISKNVRFDTCQK